jgi:hypothetical protein
MLKFSLKIIFLEQFFYEWNFFKSFGNSEEYSLFSKMESSKLINWLIIQETCAEAALVLKVHHTQNKRV